MKATQIGRNALVILTACICHGDASANDAEIGGPSVPRTGNSEIGGNQSAPPPPPYPSTAIGGNQSNPKDSGPGLQTLTFFAS